MLNPSCRNFIKHNVPIFPRYTCRGIPNWLSNLTFKQASCDRFFEITSRKSIIFHLVHRLEVILIKPDFFYFASSNVSKYEFHQFV